MDVDSMIVSEFEDVLRFRSRAGDVTRIRDRRCTAINAPLSGRAVLRCGADTLPLDPRHPLLIPRGTTYQVDFLEDSDYLLFCFQAAQAPPRVEALPALAPQELLAFHQRMEQAALRRGKGDLHRVLSELYAMLSLMHSQDAPRDPAEQAAELIRRRFADPAFRCAGLGRTLAMSDAYLRQLFQRRYRQTPRQYLEGLRMRQAQLALYEQRPVGETAQRVGYSDAFQFSRAYRRYFGYPPSEERRRAGEQADASRRAAD